MARTKKTPTQSKQTAILYARVSTQEQNVTESSLPMQEARLRAYCDRRGLTVGDVIVDAGVSGWFTLEDREGGQRLVELVQSGAVSHIVALKLDRLFRDCVDCLTVMKAWDKRNVALHLIDLGGQPLDTSSARGRFFVTMTAAIAELERHLIAERTAQVLQHKKAQGERVAAVAYGYQLKVDGIRLLTPLQEQEVINVASIDADYGQGLRKSAARLEGDGYVRQSGKPFVHTAIASMFVT